MNDAYPKKVRFVDAPIEESLIPDECRDSYGIDAAKLVRHLAWRLKESSTLCTCLMMEKEKHERLVLGISGENDG